MSPGIAERGADLLGYSLDVVVRCLARVAVGSSTWHRPPHSTAAPSAA